MEKFEPVDIDFIINNAEVKASSDKVKADLKSIGQTAEETASKVDAQLKGAFARPDNAKALEEINSKIKTQGTLVAQTRPAWNGLGNSINQISREASAFAVSAQTGFLAISNNLPILADEINRLKVKNAELTASGQQAVPVWQQVVKGLFSWQTALSVGVTLLTVYGAEIFKWVRSLLKGKEAIDEVKASQKALNDTFNSGSYRKVIKDVLELESYFRLAKKGIIDKDVVLKKYNETLGDVAGNVNTLAEAEQGLIDKAPAYVEAMLYKMAAAEAQGEAAKKLAEFANEQYRLQQESIAAQQAYDNALAKPSNQAAQAGGVFTNTSAQQSTNIIAQLKLKAEETKAAEEAYKKSAKSVIDTLNENAVAIAKAAGLDIFGDKNDDKPKKIVSDYQNLIDQLAAIDKEYTRKSFTKDEEELQALRDKFDKIKTLVQRFNADPKNKAEIIDLANLDQLQVKAEETLSYRHTTEKLKTELDEQKKLYADFEAYKTAFGIQAANKEFAGKILEAETYYDYLKQKQKENETAYSAVGNNTASGAQFERVTFIDAQLKKEETALENHFNELLKKYQTFGEKRKLITEQYEADYKALLAAGEENNAAERTIKFKEALDELAEAELGSTDTYKRLIIGVDNLSKEAAQSVIDEARRMVQALLDAGNIGQLAADGILEKLNRAQKEINNRNDKNETSDALKKRSEDLDQLAGAFFNLGDALQAYDEGLADTLTTVGELLAVTSDVAKAGAAFATGDIVGGITGSINAIAGIFRIGAKARESERKANEKLLELQYEREDGERRLNKLQRERNLDKAKEIELTIEGLKAQQVALQLSKTQAKEDERALFRELQGEQYITGSKKEKYGGFIGIGRKSRVVNTYGSLLGKTFEEIEGFYERGLLEGRVEKLFEQIRALKDEGVQIDDLLKQLQADAKEVLTGTTESSIADSIINGLKQGYSSFESFAGDIERLLQDAILNSIKYNVLEKPIKELYEQFADFAESEGELTSSEADALRAKYEEQVRTAIEQYNQLSGVLNTSALNAQAPNGLQGAIRRELTEETGSELTGLFRGQYDVTRRMLEAAEIYYEKEQQYYGQFLTLLAINTAIRDNTGQTVVELQKAVVELKIISENTQKIYLQDLG